MVISNPHKIKVYLLTGRLLHIIALTELVLIFILIPILYRIDTSHNLFLTLLRYFAMAYLLSLPVFSQLDARSRYQNYKQIKDQFYSYGFDTRILQPVLKSRCQRDAALISASELGLKKECACYFWKHGYRWYHIIPDFVFSHPQFLLSKYFWKTTFFVPKYEPKVDFSSVQAPRPKTQLLITLPNAETARC